MHVLVPASEVLHARNIVHAAKQAFDYARKRAGDVTELFGVLKGRLRPGQKGPELAVGEEGKASSGHSVLQAQYSGSSGSTVLSQANLKRIQTFLDEPQKHLGQVRTRTYVYIVDSWV